MPATPEELRQVVDAFDNAHPHLLRALADLHRRGNIVLEQHGLLDSPIERNFEAFIVATLNETGFAIERFAAALSDLEKMHLTICELERLP